MTPCRRLVQCTKGAVLAEFVIAIMPMLMAFFSFMQLGHAYTAALVMRHATVVTARYAAVTQTPCMPNKPEQDLAGAARAALGPWTSRVSVASVEASYPSRDPYAPVRSTVKFVYRCEVPLGKNIVCQGGTLTKEITVTFPHQGAKYNHAC